MENAVQDARRVAEIGKYRVLVDPPRKDLIALTEIAAQIARVPMATINLITDDAQHQVATHGFDGAICRREDSMCNVVLDAGAPVVVPDASQDPRWRDNPFVTGEIGSVRFYATHQLTTPEGVVIGTLCVFDEQPRSLSDEQEHALVGLADRVVDLLELELRTRELERSNEQLAAFAGQVSHDLRNPLTAVTLSLTMLGDDIDPDDPEDADKSFLVHRAIGGARRMQTLIDDLLKFARVGGELQRGAVDLGGVLDDVVEDLAVPLAKATVITGDLPTVTGDAVQLRAVLQNLVANAAKFVRPGEPPHIEVDAVRLDGRWRVEVADRGPGIPEEERERVFQPLARIDEEVDGSGIGLSTCRRIIDAHGGRIGLVDAAYGGTCAWFELPD
ncbi:GAF domain-containing sensor histidine kinase [Nocardioides sp. CGMCC 1.13656]|uniref:sensor histidine kinase n=1 Tax=Nocardioides TaxID=1839 RepID=UPI0012FC96C5|nr:GAF domain-containing sensor histidine kinase [Nocardioides sp. CGMCC 1.13656]MBA2952229.1 GAF domain-containing sensor histidine kinase [Nocardioides sp. CGMCC 1.13656]